jgi:hypothetical protein
MKEGRVIDPDACWLTLCATLRALHEHPEDQEARDDAVQLLRNLAAWLDHGGFAPHID